MIPEMLHKRGAVHLADEDGPAVPGLNPPRRVLELVPESVARENLVLPLSLDGETLTVAAADPGDLLLADKLSFLLNKKVKLVPAPRAAIVEAINRHYGRSETESVDSMLTEFPAAGVMRYSAPPVGGSWGRGGMPELGRTIGRTVIEFKKGIAGSEDDLGAVYHRSAAAAPRFARPGEDTTPDYGRSGMWFYVVEEGQRALMVRPDGRMEVIVGPRRVWKGATASSG